MSFEEELKSSAAKTEEIVLSFLPGASGFAGELYEAEEYSVAGGGKRLRPLLMWESFKALGGSRHTEKNCLYPLMAAIEFIHSYSLVHDDLPEMDNDMYRRGKPTTHARYGQAGGVLAGDALLNLAYETAAKALLSADETEYRNVAKAFAYLADKAGANGMVGGQYVDVAMTGRKMAPDILEYVYVNKTSALIQASLVVGAYAAGADEEAVLKLERAGRDIGLAFQIRDDILDEISSDKELGKPVHSDEANNKNTYSSIHGIEASQMEVNRLTDEALFLVADACDVKEDSFLIRLLSSLAERKK